MDYNQRDGKNDVHRNSKGAQHSDSTFPNIGRNIFAFSGQPRQSKVSCIEVRNKLLLMLSAGLPHSGIKSAHTAYSNNSQFTFRIIAIISGVVLFQQFDFETLKFEKPAPAFVYLIVFLFSVQGLLKK